MVRWGHTCSPDINKMSVEEVVTMTCLTGCDYINRLKGMSIKKAIAKVLSWRNKVCLGVTCLILYLRRLSVLQRPEEIGAELINMEAELCWPKSANQEMFPTKRKGAAGFLNRFHAARSAFMAHRVETPTWDSEMSVQEKRAGLMTGTYTGVKLAPILVPEGHWMVQFSQGIFSSTGISADEHFQRARLSIWPRTGEACTRIPYPVKDGERYPHGAFLDISKCPLWCVHPLCLRQYLDVRGLKLRQKEKARTLCKLFIRARRLNMMSFNLEVRITPSHLMSA